MGQHTERSNIDHTLNVNQDMKYFVSRGNMPSILAIVYNTLGGTHALYRGWQPK